MKITNHLLDQIIKAEGIGRQQIIDPGDFDDIIHKAHEIDPWAGIHQVNLWRIADRDADVFLMTLDLPSDLRLASVSFQPHDVFQAFPSEDTDGVCVGTAGIRKLLTFVDMHIGLALEELADHMNNA